MSDFEWASLGSSRRHTEKRQMTREESINRREEPSLGGAGRCKESLGEVKTEKQTRSHMIEEEKALDPEEEG